MATTYINYKDDNGFWIDEIYMELVFEYVLQMLKSEQKLIHFSSELIEDLEFDSRGCSRGYLILDWKYILNTHEDKLFMIDLLKNTIGIVKRKGEFISVSELNQYEKGKGINGQKWPKPLKTSEIIKILDTLILMLKDEWHETRYGMEIDYSFIN